MTPDRSTLEAYHCWLPRTDRVAGQADVTAFKQQARLHQALWRNERGYPIGSEPMKPKPTDLPNRSAVESISTSPWPTG